jgi:hypothetical protein
MVLELRTLVPVHPIVPAIHGLVLQVSLPVLSSWQSQRVEPWHPCIDTPFLLNSYVEYWQVTTFDLIAIRAPATLGAFILLGQLVQGA